MKCIAIDHQLNVLEQIKYFASRFADFNITETFNNAFLGAEYLREKKVDLLIIDVKMPGISGIDMVRSLKVKPIMIFTSAYKNLAIDGFELGALDFLLKPLTFERFERMVHKAQSQMKFKLSHENKKIDNIFVRSNYEMIKIELNSVEYIESLKDYIKIHRTNEKTVVTLMPLKTILEQLPANRFKRIHRSYIVPIAKVKSVGCGNVQLTAKELPLSQAYAGFVNEWRGM